MTHESEDDSTERLLARIGRSRLADAMLIIYFVGMVLSGVIGIVTADTGLQTLLAISSGQGLALSYDVALILVAIAGIIASVAGSRMAEFYAILGIAALTAISALLIFPDTPQVGVRLLFAPLMMVPYGWMRLGFNVSRAEVHSIRQAIADRDAKLDNGPGP